MSGFGAHLSKNVLSMKFMRRTKDKIETKKLEEKHRQHFSSSSDQITSSSTKSSNSIDTIVKEVPSYAQVIGYTFGRISFGGFNPTVEENVSKRKWKSVHVLGDVHSEDDDDSPPPVKRKKTDNLKSDKMNDDDKVYGSIIGTCGKQMLKDRKSGSESETNDNGDELDVEDIQLPEKKKSGWLNRGFRNNKTFQRSNRKLGRSPPKKRRKFMKQKPLA